MHAHPYSSKLPPLTLQCAKKIRASLPENPSDCTRVSGELQLVASRIGYVNSHRKGSRQVPANDDRQCLFATASRFPFGKGRVGDEDVLERRHHDRGVGAAAGLEGRCNEERSGGPN